MGEFISGLIIEALTSGIKFITEKGREIIKDETELSGIKEKINTFIIKNDGTILTKGSFCDYMKYHKPHEKIFHSILNSSSKYIDKNELIDEMIDIFSQKENVDPLDRMILKDFFEYIYKIYSEYLKKFINPKEEYIIHSITKNFHELFEKNNSRIEKQNRMTCEFQNEEYICYWLNKYADIDNHDYIIRKVVPVGYINNRSDNGYDEMFSDLLTVLYENVRVVLLGQAGVGKTEELKKLAHEIALQKKVPIYINLINYTDETIEKLIELELKEFCVDNFILVFDAYDEVGNSDIFSKRLNAYVAANPNQLIVISTRNNFYRSSVNGKRNSTFSKFKEFKLLSLNNDDVICYLKNQSICITTFLHEVHEKKLDGYLEIPFYLIQLTKIYKKNKRLPWLKDLLNEIIDISIDNDSDKFLTTKEIDEYRLRIKYLLKYLAFAMQCLNKIKLESELYQKILGEEDRKLLKYVGIWKKNIKDEWQFEHNNFREYLAAVYLSKLPIQTVKEVVCLKINRNTIDKRWVNVLSFLCLISEDDDLNRWLVESNPYIIIHFETERLGQEKALDLFKCIMDKCKQENKYIFWDTNQIADVARLGQSFDGIQYLIQEIHMPTNEWGLHNALDVMSNITNFLGREEEIRKCLLTICELESYTPSDKAKAIYLLGNSYLYNQKNSIKLLQIFSKNNNIEIFQELCNYILKNNLCNSSVPFILDAISRFLEIKPNYMYMFSIKRVITKVDTYEGVHQIFSYILANSDNYSVVYAFREWMKDILVNAERIFLAGDVRIVQEIKQIYMRATGAWGYLLIHPKTKYITNPDLVYKVYNEILDSKSDDDISDLESIMDYRCLDDFASKYEKDNLKKANWFITYVSRQVSTSYRYKEFVELIKKKDGKTIKEKPNYDQMAKTERGRYFDALFDKRKYSELICELLSHCEKQEDTTYEEIKDNTKFSGLFRIDLEHVLIDIQSTKFRNVQDNKVINFINSVNWESFSISHIYFMLENYEDIEVSEEKLEYIREYVMKKIQVINWDKEVTFGIDGSCSFSNRSIICLYFIYKFELVLEESVYEEILFIPFSAQKLSEEYCFKFIISKIEPSRINDIIKLDLKRNELMGGKALKIIEYCKSNKLDYAISKAESILLDKEYFLYYRRICFDYILEMTTCEHMIKQYLELLDDELLLHMAEKFVDYRNSSIIEKLEKKYKKKRSVKILTILIKMESRFALEEYYALAQAQNTIPDYTEENNVVTLTEAIQNVKREDSLDILICLAQLLYKPGFKDNTNFGLSNSLVRAIKNIAETDPEKVLICMEREKENSTNEKYKAFCNFMLKEVEQQFCDRIDNGWDVNKIKIFCKEWDEYVI